MKNYCRKLYTQNIYRNVNEPNTGKQKDWLKIICKKTMLNKFEKGSNFPALERNWMEMPANGVMVKTCPKVLWKSCWGERSMAVTVWLDVYVIYSCDRSRNTAQRSRQMTQHCLRLQSKLPVTQRSRCLSQPWQQALNHYVHGIYFQLLPAGCLAMVSDIWPVSRCNWSDCDYCSTVAAL